MADGDLLFKAKGMNHTIKVIESVNGNAIAYVGSLFGEGSATLTPEERFELAKALYPDAFEGKDLVPAVFEYGIFRGEDQVIDTTWRSKHLAELTYNPVGQKLKRRVVAGPWQDLPPGDEGFGEELR